MVSSPLGAIQGSSSRRRPHARWYVQLGRLLAPFAVMLATAVASAVVLQWLGTGVDGRVWVLGAVSVGVLALQLSWFSSLHPDLGTWSTRVIRFVYVKGLPRVGWLLVAAVACGYLAVSAQDFWKGSWRAGQTVKETGQLTVDYLNVTVTPARIIPKSGDRLDVCDGSRKAVLVGRNEGVSYVLLMPTRDGKQSEVVPLHQDDYAVATATGEPQSCNPRRA